MLSLSICYIIAINLLYLKMWITHTTSVFTRLPRLTFLLPNYINQVNVHFISIYIADSKISKCYINKDGVKIHTTEIVIEEQEFAQSKAENHINSTSPENFSGSTDNIDEDLPFN